MIEVKIKNEEGVVVVRKKKPRVYVPASYPDNWYQEF